MLFFQSLSFLPAGPGFSFPFPKFRPVPSPREKVPLRGRRFQIIRPERLRRFRAGMAEAGRTAQRSGIRCCSLFCAPFHTLADTTLCLCFLQKRPEGSPSSFYHPAFPRRKRTAGCAPPDPFSAYRTACCGKAAQPPILGASDSFSPYNPRPPMRKGLGKPHPGFPHYPDLP